MPTTPSDWIHDGTVTTYGADGKPDNVQPLSWQQLATSETAVKLLEWLTANIPEGNTWKLNNIYLQMADAHHSYNCPCWMAVAANGQEFNAGLIWYNLFFYANPTQATLDELHKLASA